MDINVLTVPALKEAFFEFVPQFERASAHTITTIFSGTDEIMTRMKAGGNGVDLVILDANSIEELNRLGKPCPKAALISPGRAWARRCAPARQSPTSARSTPQAFAGCGTIDRLFAQPERCPSRRSA